MKSRYSKKLYNKSSVIKTNRYNTKAVLCPVCCGSGVYISRVQNPNTTTCGFSYGCTCHGCGGKGWIVIADL